MDELFGFFFEYLAKVLRIVATANCLNNEFTQWMRKDPAPVLDALDRAADGLCLLAQSCIRHSLDAVFFASLGAEHRFGLMHEEFARFIEPYDKRVLATIHEAGGPRLQ